MACHPEQPFTAAQEDRIREIVSGAIRDDRASRAISVADLYVGLRLTPPLTASECQDSMAAMGAGRPPSRQGL